MPKSTVTIDGAALRALREAKFLSQDAVARKAGIAPSRLSWLETGMQPRVHFSTFSRLARALDMTESELAKVVARKDICPASRSSFNAGLLRRIPYFRERIAAGPWVETIPRETPDGWVPAPDELSQEAFAVQIEGDSMEPAYLSGDIVFFQPYRPGEPDHELREGAAYYVEHSDGKATFKLLYVDRRRERYRLQALNKEKYPEPLYVPFQLVARLSRAVAYIRRV